MLLLDRKDKGEFNMNQHGESIFVFDFDSEEDRIVMLERGSFYISRRLFFCSSLA